LSFIQSDGFNPLTVNGDSFQVIVDSSKDNLPHSHILNLSSPLYQASQKIFSLSLHQHHSSLSEESTIHDIAALLSVPWRPGQLLNDLKKLKLEFPETIRPIVLITAVRISTPVSSATYSVKGFWTDHWTYLLDLVESYLNIYPEHEEHSLYVQEIPFYMSPAVVKRRYDRYAMMHSSFSSDTQEMSYEYRDIDLRRSPSPSLSSSPSSSLSVYSLPTNVSIQIISTVCNEEDSPKDLLKSTKMPCYPSHRKVAMAQNPHWQLDQKTKEVTKVNVIGKLFLLAIIKFSTLDPFGMGIEMEGTVQSPEHGTSVISLCSHHISDLITSLISSVRREAWME
jgi:hypothetical protein